ncbi:hypothetical protein PybrP1_001986 [[Pythium] brassicae (nom. inval.)]|nr:hypothetical protein PybrP1_001986 [[Pythium] brassicae (nom. inval.)]
MGDLEVRLRAQNDEKRRADAASLVEIMTSAPPTSPSEVAHFLHALPHMDPKMVGRVLGEPDDTSLSILQEYANGFVFQDFSIDVALRAFLGRFALPGEAQKIDRILQAFAKAYFAANPQDPTCASEDAVYTLAFSLVLLNTDAHNPRLARRFKMGKDDFIRNHRRVGVDGGGGGRHHLPRAYLAQCYDSFAGSPITLLAQKAASMLAEDEVEVEFGDGPLGLAIETSIDGRTCLVKSFAPEDAQLRRRRAAFWHDATSASTRAAGPQLAGWVVVAVGADCTRQIGYPLVRYLLRTAARPVVVRFCEPSVYFASLAE